MTRTARNRHPPLSGRSPIEPTPRRPLPTGNDSPTPVPTASPGDGRGAGPYPPPAMCRASTTIVTLTSPGARNG